MSILFLLIIPFVNFLFNNFAKSAGILNSLAKLLNKSIKEKKFFIDKIKIKDKENKEVWNTFKQIAKTPIECLGAYVISMTSTASDILSVYFLGEKITYLKILCALVGFIGTILVIQPGFSSFNIYSAYAFISGLFYAMYLIYTRKVNFISDSLITLSYSTIPGAVIMTILSYLKFSMLKSFEPVPNAFINVTISLDDIIFDNAFVD